MRPAHAWRHDPDQLASPVARRLLGWVESARLDVGGDVERVGRNIAEGLAELMGAREVLLLARQWPQEELWPLCRFQRDFPLSSASDNSSVEPLHGSISVFGRAAATQSDGPAGFEARHLLSVLPDTPLWLEEAAPHVQVFIGDLCDYVAAATPDLQEIIGFAPQSTLTASETAAPLVPTLSTENEASDITPSPTRISDVVAEGLSGVQSGLQSRLGDASFDASALQSTLNSQRNARLPGLIVPLRSLAFEGQAPITGLVLLWIDSDDGLLSSQWQAPLEAAAWQAGGWLAGALRSERFGRSYRELAEVCANAIDGRDAKRAGHSGAVAYYCGLVARSLGIEESEVERIEFAGLLHDIGKVAVPDAILQKNAPLTLEELDTVRSSTINGADWLGRVEGLESVAAIVRYQAERWDGSGFPEGLSGEEIPIGARILSVALRFSAMTKPRADRAAMSVVGGAFEALAAEAGAALDPRVVEAFLNAMGRSMGV